MDVQPLQPQPGLGLCQGETLGAKDLSHPGTTEPPFPPEQPDPKTGPVSPHLALTSCSKPFAGTGMSCTANVSPPAALKKP